MRSKMNSYSNRGSREIWLVTCCALLLGSQVSQAQAAAQVPEANKDNVAKAVANVSSGSFQGVDLDLIRRTGAVEAIAALEEQFRRVQDTQDKANIAGTLVKLGDKDNAYWDFLAKLATQALDSDAPDFMSYDAQGKALPGPSPAFIAWAKAHNVPPNGPAGTAAEDAMYWFPGKVALLGSTGDPRAIPLLRQALSSPNHMIEIVAAKGLAEMQDKDSIPLIIEACKRAPAEGASAIAESLVYFDDPSAQKAVDTYVDKDRAKLLRETKARGKKTPGSN
jgi:hypothetical protein